VSGRTRTRAAREPAPEPPPDRARHRRNLIEEITADAVVSDYLAVDAEPSPSSRRERILVAGVAAGVVGFVLAVGVSARVLNAPVVDQQRVELRERITANDERRDELTAKVERLREDLQQARQQALTGSIEGLALAETVSDYELATGYVAATGPGAVVTLRDAQVGEDGAELDEDERVLDIDVQRGVNGLWAAGAEAVAVNGQRLSARSAIRSAASAILVNYRPLKPPYRIEAIGPDTMADAFQSGQDAAYLRGVSEQYGIGFTTDRAEDLRLPAAGSTLPDKAEPITPGEGER
jgi:uncharacterized protein YlxW (UPF0749 family)